MQIRELYTDDRAVSPVVGVALLIAIAVILAAVIGAVVLGLGTGGVDTPQAQMQADYNFDGTDGNIEVSHNGGEPLPAEEIKFVTDTAEVDMDEIVGDDLTAGGSIAFTDTELGGLENGETVAVIWEDPNSDSETVLEEFDP